MKDWYKYEEVNCNLCNEEEKESLSDKGQFNLPTHVVLCKNCGLAYLSPRWNKNAYEDFYENEYDKYYRPKKLEDNEVEFRYARPIIERINGFLQKSDKLNILDIGSGDGSLIKLIEKCYHGANLYAIEPSSNAKEILWDKKIKYLGSDVESDWDTNYHSTFDFVIMRHVLEHFSDPHQVLLKVRQVLKENAIVYIAVPDNYNPSSNLKGSWFRVVHTYYFNSDTLNSMLLKSGFKIEYIGNGNKNNPHELFAIAKKSTSFINSIGSDVFYKQFKVFDKQARNEKIPGYHLYRKIKRRIGL